MVLVMSVENTNLSMGCYAGENLLFTSRMATDRCKTGDEYAIAFRSILELYGVRPENISGSIVASVVPALINEIKSSLRLLLGKEPLVVGPGVKTGLNIRIDNPSVLGSDQVVCAVAAAAEYPVPLVVMDLDTAVTLMVVDEKKTFVGSVIAPGPGVAVSALAASCDQLPMISLEAPGGVVGKNTVDAMKSGAVFGTAAMLDGLVDRIWQQMGSEYTLVATGTLVETVLPHCRKSIIRDRHLILKGLKRIYDKNIGK